MSVSIYRGNIINSVIKRSQLFAANILTHSQLHAGMHFAKSLNDNLSYQQFAGVPHSEGIKGEACRFFISSFSRQDVYYYLHVKNNEFQLSAVNTIIDTTHTCTIYISLVWGGNTHINKLHTLEA